MASKPKWIELLDEFAKVQYRQQHADVRFAARTRLVVELERAMSGIDESGDVVGEDDTPSVVDEVLEELVKARRKFAPMHGPHEGYAVILEELDELWEEVRQHRDGSGITLGRMRAEAVQVAAMALRFIYDVCDQEEPKVGGTDDDEPDDRDACDRGDP